ncbi:hypothetical protein [Devosia sp.]|uniref:hypothetical protein n=1 Tax=Devosia sp. TaxID=1871048 RepID=UPI001AC22FB1|nr:hypothetical protein [Devosia sp.]MBN9332786.1 hypothetical protein [Devosia sp.]
MQLSLIRCSAVAVLIVLPAPLQAAEARDMGIIRNMVDDLDHESRFMRLNGALAACLAGEGDQYLASGWFEDHGWLPRVDTDMGIVEMTNRSHADLYAWIAEDGSACQIWAEDVGTQDAFDILNELAEAAGLPVEEAEGEVGCPAITLVAGNVGYLAEVTSSGNDPVCIDVNTSRINFVRAEG